MVVAGDYSLSIYEGTEQEILPQLLVPHPKYNDTTNNNDIMLIKVGFRPRVEHLVVLFPPCQLLTDPTVRRLSSWRLPSFWTASSPSPCCRGREPPSRRARCVECPAGGSPAPTRARSPPPSARSRCPSSPRRSATAASLSMAASRRTWSALVTAMVGRMPARWTVRLNLMQLNVQTFAIGTCSVPKP